MSASLINTPHCIELHDAAGLNAMQGDVGKGDLKASRINCGKFIAMPTIVSRLLNYNVCLRTRENLQNQRGASEFV